jgi:Rad3-related DNA helicase
VRANFPFAHYRAGQREALDAARDAFAEGRRVVVIEAPTGSGKSALAITLAREARSAYLLTAQKVLQEQYQRDFSDLALLKGRANYACEVAPTHAGAAPCMIGRTFPECEACSYFRAKARAMAAPRALLNYAYFLHELNYAGAFGPRELLVLDEAHNVEGMLMGFVQAHISDAQLARVGIPLRLPGFPESDALFDFADDLPAYLHERAASLDGELQRGELPVDLQLEVTRNRQWLDNTARRLNWLQSSRDDDVPWVVEHHLDAHGAAVTFKPVVVAPFAHELLFAHAERTLLLSATVLDAGTFLRGIGVAPEEAAVITVASTFPAARRPLVLRPVARLTRHQLERELPRLSHEVAEILRDHDGEKGVVHAHSYRIAQAIYRALPADLRARVITHHDASGRDAALEAHLNRPEPTALLSPSMTEGLDLVGDLARWQVICKLPYPYLGDPQIAARRASEPGWYEWRTCLTLVQAYGRAVRSEDDHAVTYLLDADAPSFLTRQQARLPGWFREAIRAP